MVYTLKNVVSDTKKKKKQKYTRPILPRCSRRACFVIGRLSFFNHAVVNYSSLFAYDYCSCNVRTGDIILFQSASAICIKNIVQRLADVTVKNEIVRKKKNKKL